MFLTTCNICRWWNSDEYNLGMVFWKLSECCPTMSADIQMRRAKLQTINPIMQQVCICFQFCTRSQWIKEKVHDWTLKNSYGWWCTLHRSWFFFKICSYFLYIYRRLRIEVSLGKKTWVLVSIISQSKHRRKLVSKEADKYFLISVSKTKNLQMKPFNLIDESEPSEQN